MQVSFGGRKVFYAMPELKEYLKEKELRRKRRKRREYSDASPTDQQSSPAPYHSPGRDLFSFLANQLEISAAAAASLQESTAGSRQPIISQMPAARHGRSADSYSILQRSCARKSLGEKPVCWRKANQKLFGL